MITRTSVLLGLAIGAYAAAAQQDVEAIRRNFFDLSGKGVLVTAHRAPHATHPENSTDATFLPPIRILHSLSPRDTVIGDGSTVAILSIQAARHPGISAHRGASRVAPENTLASFSKAMKMGADFVEVDVRTTADGEQICLHDASLKRTTGLDATVNSVSFKDIKKFPPGAGLARRMKKNKSLRWKRFADWSPGSIVREVAMSGSMLIARISGRRRLSAS